MACLHCRHTYHIAHNVMTHREEVIYIVDENSDSEVSRFPPDRTNVMRTSTTPSFREVVRR
jgi:hypothetical protein